MSEVRHTPGPWKITAASFTIKAAAVGTVVYGNPDNPNRLADARLIAAAPDLLEALKGVLRVADRATTEFDAARAAIAKATTAGQLSGNSGQLTTQDQTS